MTDVVRAALLSDIVYWGERLASELANLQLDDFLADVSACDAACWCILCVGEAAGALHRANPDLADRFPELQLAKAYGMRNRLAHDYGGIDYGVVWQAATVSVPALVEAARRARDDVD